MTAGGDLSVYVHVPFCVSKCPYCDFHSGPTDNLPDETRKYFELIERELWLLWRGDERLGVRRRVVTLYIGGGTPSLVDPDLYRRFFERLRSVFEVAPLLEWTLEVNPGTVDGERLDAFLDLGINRLSLGVQSFSDETLERLGRSHRVADTRNVIERLAGVERQSVDWGIDLIFGVPGQTLEQWESDLEAAVACHPHHCSVYGLTIHDGTVFDELERAGRIETPDEETQREMFLLARRRLTETGYEHYEISNYALPGRRSRHNERYWTGDDYLGLGVAAHSMVGGVRWSNPEDVSLYGESVEGGRLPRRIEQRTAARSFFGERVMLGLRRLEGIDLAAFRSQFGADLVKMYNREIERLSRGGLIEFEEGHMRLTEEGLLVADTVMALFF